MTFRIIWTTMIAICVLALSSGECRAGWMITLDGQATAQGDGYTYLYTLANQSTSGEFAFDLSIEVAPEAALSGFGTPPGWELLYTPGDSLVEWLATPSGTDGLDNVLRPGESVEFSFFSHYGPGSSAFTVVGDSGGDLATADGTTVGPVTEPGAPVSTPEPSSLVLCGLAAACMAARHVRNRIHGRHAESHQPTADTVYSRV